MKKVLLTNKLVAILTEEDYENIIDHICRPFFMENGKVVSCKCSIKNLNVKNSKRIKNCTLTVSNDGVHIGYYVNKKALET